MLHDFDLNLLVYLDALISEQSVSKAADRVHITQPSMSLALTRLRKHFGDQLLVSIGRNMTLTPLARSLAVPVREAVMKVQLVSTTVAEFDPARSTRTFSIATSDYVMCVLLKTLLPCLSTEAPGIRIEMRPLYILDQRKDVEPPDLIIAPKDGHVPQDLRSERLWLDTWTCIVWSENRLVGDELTVQKYTELGHVLSGADEHITSGPEIVRRMEVHAHEMCLVPQAVMETNRIATVATRLAQVYAKQCSLRLFRPPIEFPPLSEYMFWHPSQHHEPGTTWLRNRVKMATVQLSPLPHH
jgi:DNA-binding transcriptional LysR family regulator